ncbi:MAG: tRNA (adenine-N(1)-)-methyltransferase catalytic subunit trm61 [Stictis urceolatum]|nr:tRNA (adenine-N(1)-)-methyltransferase catalytic subunit trm61 [Stictis urceolata]
MDDPPPSQQPSTFLSRGAYAEADSLALIYLKRDLQVPVVLSEVDEQNEGYDEGKVTNTRFGSFPHSTLIGVPWGSQIRASAVDTGSRGRRPQDSSANAQKRKRGTDTPDSADVEAQKAAKEASTGFAYLIPPTPETWTSSLPHRTQVVYTPDYSFILQRLRARPGTVLIEAGAGSGSFTHAAVRSVFSGYPSSSSSTPHRLGKVFSFEFHESRYQSLKAELLTHHLDSLVHPIHRDVYEEGFQLPPSVHPSNTPLASQTDPVVQANAIFLDLPAPWLALPHLTRSSTATRPSALDPRTAARICTFSPCIEQVQRTITALRAHGWMEISMIELAAHRLETRRERVGLNEEGLHGTNASPADVEEALSKLRELEKRAAIVQAQAQARSSAEDRGPESKEREIGARERRERLEAGLVSRQERLRGIKEGLKGRELWREGRLVHRLEPEVKTHTSYLVFAVLPRVWGEEEERRARVEVRALGEEVRAKSKRQMKREAKALRIEEVEGKAQAS